VSQFVAGEAEAVTTLALDSLGTSCGIHDCVLAIGLGAPADVALTLNKRVEHPSVVLGDESLVLDEPLEQCLRNLLIASTAELVIVIELATEAGTHCEDASLAVINL